MHTLLRAMMKGVLRILRRLMDSMVCGSRLCMRSTTRTAMSHRLLPRERRLLKDSWPAQASRLRSGTHQKDEALLHACDPCQASCEAASGLPKLQGPWVEHMY